jgi:hypothetical protein
MSVSPRHAPRAPRTPFLVVVIALLGGGLVLLLALNTASAANEVQRHGVAEQDAGVAARVAQLRIDVANSAAPGNLAAVAAQFGMVPAGNPAFLQIGTDGRVRVLGSAAPATAAPLPAPHTKARPKPKPAPTTSAKASTTATGTKPKPKPTSTSSARSTPTPKPSPTPTPTPTITLPGGTR